MPLINIWTNCLLQNWNLTQSWGKCFQTIWQHSSAQVIISQGKYCTKFCLFVLANQMQASKTQIFGYLWHLLLFPMPSSRLKCGKKLRNMSPSRFVSTALHKSLLHTVIIFGRLEMPPRSPSAKRVQAFDGCKSCIFQQRSLRFCHAVCAARAGWMYFAWEVKTNWRIFTLRCRSVSEVM